MRVHSRWMPLKPLHWAGTLGQDGQRSTGRIDTYAPSRPANRGKTRQFILLDYWYPQPPDARTNTDKSVVAAHWLTGTLMSTYVDCARASIHLDHRGFTGSQIDHMGVCMYGPGARSPVFFLRVFYIKYYIGNP